MEWKFLLSPISSFDCEEEGSARIERGRVHKLFWEQLAEVTLHKRIIARKPTHIFNHSSVIDPRIALIC